MSELRIRQPHFADGMWYGATPTQLQREIQGYLEQAPANPDLGEVIWQRLEKYSLHL